MIHNYVIFSIKSILLLYFLSEIFEIFEYGYYVVNIKEYSNEYDYFHHNT